MVVGAPVGDGLFDGFGLEVLGEGLVEEGGQLDVRGEAESDELFEGEVVNVLALVGWEKRFEAQAFFEADEAVLQLEVVDAAFEGEDEEGERNDDGPVAEPGVFVPEADGDVDGDSQVGDDDWEDEEVHGGVGASVVAEALRGGHRAESFRFGAAASA